MAAVVNIVGAKGSADGATNLTTAAVTPGGADRAALVFTLGESNSGGGYATNVRLNTIGGSEIDDFTSADVHIGGGGREAFGKVFGEIATPTSSTAFYALFPGAGNGIAAISVFFEDVDQADPFGTEQVSADDALGSGTTTISCSFSGLTEGDLVIGCLFVRDFVVGNSTATVNTGTTLHDSIVNEGPENDWESLFIVSGEADGSGNCTLSMDVTMVGVLSGARMWGIPVNGSASGTTYEVAAAQAVDVGDSASAQNTVGASAAQAVDVGDSATSQAVMASEAAQAVDVADSAVAQNSVEAAAAQAIDVGDTAAAQITLTSEAAQAVDAGDSATIQNTAEAAAAQAVDVSDTASAQNIVAADAAQAVDVGDTATAVSGSDLLGADGTDLSDSAANTAVLGEAVSDAVDVGDAATNQAVVGSAAADAADMGDSATSSMAGGNVYDVDAIESMGLDDSSTAPGIFSVEATDGIDVGDLALSASGATGDLEAKIDALTLLVQQLAQDVATAKSFYVGGPDYNDYERRDLLRNYDRGVDIKAQNAMLMQMFKAIVNRDTP